MTENNFGHGLFQRSNATPFPKSRKKNQQKQIAFKTFSVVFLLTILGLVTTVSPKRNRDS